MANLRFGIHSGQQHSTFADYVELWRLAEDAGLEWASVFDHFQPIQSPDREGPCFEALTLLAAMAAHTTRLRIGVVVLGVTYRNPGVLAKAAVTIDHASNGRLELGLGAAWHEQEHGEYGIPFPPIGERMDMLDEACRVLRSLFTERSTSFEGRHFTFREALCEPKPLQQPLPLWIGGSGERRTLRIVAEHATGWNTFGGDLDTYRHKLGVLESHCRDVGRDPGEIRKQLVFSIVLGADEAEAEERLRERAERLGRDVEELRSQMFVGTPEAFADSLGPYLELGAQDILILQRPAADTRTIELFASQVAASLR